MDGTSAKFPRRPAAIDVSELRRTPLREQLLGHFFSPAVLRALRALKPIVRTPQGVIIVTRFDDVEEVLRQDRIFQVEGERIRAANGGPNFLLGMQDDSGCPHRRAAAVAGLRASQRGYRDYQQLVMQVFRLGDLELVASLVKTAAEAALNLPPSASGQVELDAIARLITHIPIALCRDYYGLDIADPQEFAHITFLISRWLFDPDPKSRFDQPGRLASARLNALIDAAILNPPSGDTILQRLLVEARVDPETARVIVFGMVVGFVPTSTMAGGHILEVLLAREDCRRGAAEAAHPRSGSDERLQRCLFEAMRFKPLSREPLRICTEPYTLAEGKWYRQRIEVGERVLALTASAMLDERALAQSQVFDPNRPAHQSLLFGQGLHRCIGAPLAEVQITQMFKPLLQRGALRRAPGAAGALTTLGPFPEHLFVRFDA
jgi:cytochrome P450